MGPGDVVERLGYVPIEYKNTCLKQLRLLKFPFQLGQLGCQGHIRRLR